MSFSALTCFLVPLPLLVACAAPLSASPSVPQAALASSATDAFEAVIATIPLDLAGETQVAVEGAVWLRLIDGSVRRVDPATRAVVSTIKVGSGEFGDIVAGEGGVWVTTFDQDKVTRIDPTTSIVVAEITVGRNP